MVVYHDIDVTRDLDVIRVKGKTLPVGVFEVLQDDRDPVPAERAHLLDIHQRGLALYRERRFREALQVFEDGRRAFPRDVPFLIYAERCSHLEETPPAADWDGVWTLTEK